MNDAKNWRHAVMLESGDVAHIELSASSGYRIDNPRLSFDLDRKELVLRFRVEAATHNSGAET